MTIYCNIDLKYKWIWKQNMSAFYFFLRSLCVSYLLFPQEGSEGSWVPHSHFHLFFLNEDLHSSYTSNQVPGYFKQQH